MPARKSDARRSDVSVARFVLADDDTPMATESHAPEAAEPSASASTPVDLTLPKSIITRLAKGVLPPNTQIQANAILALTKSATVFINHLANSANEFTVSSGKKTIMPADVFKALDDIEYGFMREKLEAEFAKFNEVQTSKRSTYRKKVAAAKKAAAAGGSQATAADTSMMSIGSTGTGADEADRSLLPDSGSAGPSRAAKKAKMDPNAADTSKMELDENEPSDAETVPEEPEEEEEDDEMEEEEDEEDEEDEPEGADEERDDLEERSARHGDEDEALDDDSD
ncbi:DNA polymerase epsilon subunit D [Madurella mycetomatis]|uniref:DNA polymerase epsilon subunit D n=1 Tax=Madurella mycetomatis TaxID=100816 RepID=A0A175W8R5_9PEZI|nr:DNA polymerase epsilon subunit D [Madurella mycetomatis]